MTVEALGEIKEREEWEDGTTEASNTTTRVDIFNNLQSSVADLQILHTREVRLLQMLEQDGELMRTVTEEFTNDGFSLESVIHSDILHPVDSYNLIKRTARTWARIVEKMDLSVVDADKKAVILSLTSTFPSWERSRQAVALGILNIHKYYDLEPGDLVRGVLHDAYRNITYHAKTRYIVSMATCFKSTSDFCNHLQIECG